jgi:hypothetical protein
MSLIVHDFKLNVGKLYNIASQPWKAWRRTKEYSQFKAILEDFIRTNALETRQRCVSANVPNVWQYFSCCKEEGVVRETTLSIQCSVSHYYPEFPKQLRRVDAK